jgi:hypothetical protein
LGQLSLRDRLFLTAVGSYHDEPDLSAPMARKYHLLAVGRPERALLEMAIVGESQRRRFGGD